MRTPSLASLAALAFFAASGAAIASPPLENKAQNFVDAAGHADQYEIQSSRVIVTQSQNPQVKAFAQMMIDDHGRTSAALKQAAQAQRLEPPPETVSADQMRMLSALQSLKDQDLDKAYVTQQVNAHAMALVTMQGYAKTGDNAALRQTAAHTAPLIQQHLDQVRQMKAQLGD